MFLDVTIKHLGTSVHQCDNKTPTFLLFWSLLRELEAGVSTAVPLLVSLGLGAPLKLRVFTSRLAVSDKDTGHML